jgi:hypothetical protein
MANPIVTVNVSLTEAPTPNTLQGTGALISQGGTNTSPGTMTLLTLPSSLQTALQVPKALTTLASETGVATATAAAPHGFTVGDTLQLVIAGAAPAAYNGTVTATVTSPTAFTYPVTGTPSTPATDAVAGVPITYLPFSAVELQQMNSTFFGQGANVGVFVLELGPGNANDGVAFLNTWIANNPGIFYAYLVPREWDGNANYLAFLAQFEAATSKTYFWTTTTLQNFGLYTPLMKDVFAMIEAPVFDAYPANALTAITFASGVVTAMTTTAHGVSPGSYFQIAGVTPAGYNGFFLAQPGTTGETLVYDLATNPGTETVLGTLVANLYASPGIPSTEFSLASAFAAALAENPLGGFVPPFGYTFLNGVTQFPTMGTNSLTTELLAAGVNIVGTASEGGLSNTLLLNGTFMDGNSFNFWFSTDCLNINVNLDISNAVIDGSNSNVAPLFLNQNGINTLQGVGAGTISTLISNGLIFGTLVQTELTGPQFQAAVAAGQFAGLAVINAIPFAVQYAGTAGAALYKEQSYPGFAVSFTPQLGFRNITFNLDATQFV